MCHNLSGLWKASRKCRLLICWRFPWWKWESSTNKKRIFLRIKRKETNFSDWSILFSSLAQTAFKHKTTNFDWVFEYNLLGNFIKHLQRRSSRDFSWRKQENEDEPVADESFIQWTRFRAQTFVELCWLREKSKVWQRTSFSSKAPFVLTRSNPLRRKVSTISMNFISASSSEPKVWHSLFDDEQLRFVSISSSPFLLVDSRRTTNIDRATCKSPKIVELDSMENREPAECFRLTRKISPFDSFAEWNSLIWLSSIDDKWRRRFGVLSNSSSKIWFGDDDIRTRFLESKKEKKMQREREKAVALFFFFQRIEKNCKSSTRERKSRFVFVVCCSMQLRLVCVSASEQKKLFEFVRFAEKCWMRADREVVLEKDFQNFDQRQTRRFQGDVNFSRQPIVIFHRIRIDVMNFYVSSVFLEDVDDGLIITWTTDRICFSPSRKKILTVKNCSAVVFEKIGRLFDFQKNDVGEPVRINRRWRIGRRQTTAPDLENRFEINFSRRHRTRRWTLIHRSFTWA